MGIDLYAGPLSRYLMLDWETPAARFSREHGLAHEVVYQNQPKKHSKREAASFTKSFRNRLGKKLGKLPEWQTEPSGPYDAWQLREGLDAAVLAAAHMHRPELTMPIQLPENVHTHPAVSESTARNYYLGPMAVFEAHMIVPGIEPRICSDTNHRDSPIIVATTAALEDSVEDVREFLRVSTNDLLRIVAEGPPPSGAISIKADNGEWFEEELDLPANPVLAHASWGLACFHAALQFSRSTGALIIRDE